MGGNLGGGNRDSKLTGSMIHRITGSMRNKDSQDDRTDTRDNRPQKADYPSQPGGPGGAGGLCIIHQHDRSLIITRQSQHFKLQQLGPTIVRLRSYWSSFVTSRRALSDESNPELCWSSSVHLRSYRYEKSPLEELYRTGVFSRQ